MDKISYLEMYNQRVVVFRSALCKSFFLEVSLEKYDEIVKFFKDHEKALAVLDDTFALGCKEIADKFVSADDDIGFGFGSYDPASGRNVNILTIKRYMLDFYTLGLAYYIHNDILKESLMTIVTKMIDFKKKLIEKIFSIVSDVVDLYYDSVKYTDIERHLKIKELVEKVVSK